MSISRMAGVDHDRPQGPLGNKRPAAAAEAAAPAHHRNQATSGEQLRAARATSPMAVRAARYCSPKTPAKQAIAHIHHPSAKQLLVGIDAI